MYLFSSLIYPGAALILLLITLGTYIWYKKRLRLLDMSTETTGVITKLAEPKPNPRNPDAELLYRMWIEYTVNGKKYKTYMHREVSKGSYQEGQEVTVVYDPDKPSRAMPKDFSGAKSYWVSFPIMFLCLAVVFVLITIHSLPDVLDMSSYGSTVFGIVFNFCISAGIIAGIIAFRRSDYYRREKEKDLKSAKGNIIAAVAILGKFLFDAIFDLIFYVILK